MTSPGPRDHWSNSSAAPVVTIVSGHAGLPGAGFAAHDSRNRRGANSDGVNAATVMSLLACSTTLALYDLYVLASTLAAS
jgi:hypothetical protein